MVDSGEVAMTRFLFGLFAPDQTSLGRESAHLHSGVYIHHNFMNVDYNLSS